MRVRRLVGVLLLAAAGAAAGAPPATQATGVELKGTVVAVSGTDVRIRVDGDLLPRVGDPVRLSFTIPGGPSLLVGTWRVQGVEAGIVTATVVEATGRPTIDQTATIISASPRSRAAGPASPAASERTVDITQRQFPSGKLSLGDGSTELSPGRLVIRSSAGLNTWYALGTEAAADYRVSLGLMVEKGPGPDHVAGVLLVRSLDALAGALSPGDVFFGKNWQGLLVARFAGQGAWTDLPVLPGAGPARAEDLDQLEVMSRAGRYEFRLNGRLVASWSREQPRMEWVVVQSGRGSRTELRDWRVERLTGP